MKNNRNIIISSVAGLIFFLVLTIYYFFTEKEWAIDDNDAFQIRDSFYDGTVLKNAKVYEKYIEVQMTGNNEYQDIEDSNDDDGIPDPDTGNEVRAAEFDQLNAMLSKLSINDQRNISSKGDLKRNVPWLDDVEDILVDEADPDTENEVRAAGINQLNNLLARLLRHRNFSKIKEEAFITKTADHSEDEFNIDNEVRGAEIEKLKELLSRLINQEEQ